MNNPIVSKILNLSTAHLWPDTMQTLVNEGTDAYDLLDAVTIYPKFAKDDIIGWYMYITEDPATGDFSRNSKIYNDIRNAMLLAEKYDCEGVCFDVDEDTTPELPIYEED